MRFAHLRHPDTPRSRLLAIRARSTPLAIAGGEYADGDQPGEASALAQDAARAFWAEDAEAFAAAVEQLEAVAVCIEGLAIAQDAAAVHRAVGLARLQEGDADRAALHFAAAQHLDREWALPSDWEGTVVDTAWASAREVELAPPYLTMLMGNLPALSEAERGRCQPPPRERTPSARRWVASAIGLGAAGLASAAVSVGSHQYYTSAPASAGALDGVYATNRASFGIAAAALVGAGVTGLVGGVRLHRERQAQSAEIE